MSHDTTFFTTPNATFNKADREAVAVIDGRPRMIKHPQAGHVGDYDAPVRTRGEGVRWISVVKTDGNVVYYTITAGAGDSNPNSEYAAERKQKMRHLGWFPVGECPLRVLEPNQFVDKSLVGDAPCDSKTCSRTNPCPHSDAERAARVAAHNELDAERCAAVKDPNEKLIAANAENNRELVAALTAAIAAKPSVDASAIAEILAALKKGGA
jgi:hypothetical protein